MALFLFHTFLLYFLVFGNKVLSLSNVIVRDLDLEDTVLPGRQLRAAKRSHELGIREVKGCLQYDHNLHYLDGEFPHFSVADPD